MDNPLLLAFELKMLMVWAGCGQIYLAYHIVTYYKKKTPDFWGLVMSGLPLMILLYAVFWPIFDTPKE